jgi:hypothetical protein
MDIKAIPVVLASSPTQNSGNANTPLLIGKQYIGSIIGFDSEGLASVQIGNQVFSMPLPSTYDAQEVVQLRYLGGDPRPSFLLLQATDSSYEAANVSLSESGKLITQFLEESAAFTSLNAVEIAEISPLMESVNNPELTALELQNALTMSGLFYESHLANFLQGKRSMDVLKREPQNQSGYNRAQMVAKQLETLENQETEWAGMIWPGQYMRWIVHPDTKDSETDSGDDQACSSVLELVLPKLGKLRCLISLQNGKSEIEIESELWKSKDQLEAAIPMLQKSFSALKMRLQSVSIKHVR